MIVSSVYSWLKDLRSNCDIYEEKSGAFKIDLHQRRRCSCASSYQEDMFDIPEIETVLLRNDYGRRSFPIKKTAKHRNGNYGNYKCTPSGGGIPGANFAELCMQERAKKAWSVGDAWGVDFQLKKPQETVVKKEKIDGIPPKRRDSEMTDDTIKEALDEFSFLSDVDVDNDVLDDSGKGVPDNDQEPIYVNIGRVSKANLKTPSTTAVAGIPPQPIYMNITTLGNPKLQQQLLSSKRDSATSNMSLSSTYSFVSCGLSENTLGSTQTLDSSSSSMECSLSQSSGTYTVNSLYSDFKNFDDFKTASKISVTSTCSGSTFQTEDTYSIQDEDDWKMEQWRSLCSLEGVPGTSLKSQDYDIDSKLRNPLKPLKKGKSLDSFNLGLSIGTECAVPEVQLRRNHVNRRSVIPVMDSAEARKAIIMPKCPTPDQQNTYLNIWECFSKPGIPAATGMPSTSDSTGLPNQKFKPIPAPRTKFSKPPTPPKPRTPRTPGRSTPTKLTALEIKNARENIVSFAFDETVEYLQVPDAAKDTKKEVEIDNECERLPPLDVVMWMTRIMGECEWEPDTEIPPGYDSDNLLATKSSEDSQPRRKSSRRQEIQDMMFGQQSPGITWDSSNQDYGDNRFDFNNVKKYKMDNQVIKLNKNDIIEKENGKLLHKNSEGTKTLAEKFEDCKLEQKGPREHILILPDKKRINLYSKNSKEKPDSPESVRSAPAKTDMRNRLMQLFKFRPARDTLRDRGILKNENVFGNTLHALDIRHDQPVPNLVRKCIEYVELPANIETQGLYRSSASLAILQEIRFAINETYGKDLSSLEKYKTSPDVPSGLLKLFIRELKEPLIGMDEFERMHEICKNYDPMEQKHEAIFKIINSMLLPHRATLDLLLKHLTKVISHQDKNDMTVEGISICWGQTMITGGEGSDLILMARSKNEVVELLLKAYKAQRSKDLEDNDSIGSNVSEDGSENLHIAQTKSNTCQNIKQNQLTKGVCNDQTKESTVTKDKTKSESSKHITKEGLVKPSRIPQRQPSVENYMKPKVTNDSTICQTMSANIGNAEAGVAGGGNIFGSKTSLGGVSGISGASGSYVQTLASKLQNKTSHPLSGRNLMRSVSRSSSRSTSRSMESLNKLGSTMSLCPENQHSANLRLKFIMDLIYRIEHMPDIKGVYRGKGKHSVVEKLVRKYKKENSKEFHRNLAKASIFDLGKVLQEVIKELNYEIEFYDMQTLVEDKNKEEMRHILDEIPEEIILVFRHFDNLRKRSDLDRVTILSDMFQTWWPILVGSPHGKEDAKGKGLERVGRNLDTFDQLIQIIMELSTMKNKIRSASLYDLRQINEIGVANKVERKVSCCYSSNNRLTSYYSRERL